jgi:hypothetical protein
MYTAFYSDLLGFRLGQSSSILKNLENKGQWAKSKTAVILSVKHHGQNTLESTVCNAEQKY